MNSIPFHRVKITNHEDLLDDVCWQETTDKISTVLFVEILSDDLCIVSVEHIDIVLTYHFLQETDSMELVLDDPVSSDAFHINSVSIVVILAFWYLSKTFGYDFIILVVVVIIILFKFVMPEVTIDIRYLRWHDLNNFFIVCTFQLQDLLIGHLNG
jgi:hypothetical protein